MSGSSGLHPVNSSRLTEREFRLSIAKIVKARMNLQRLSVLRNQGVHSKIGKLLITNSHCVSLIVSEVYERRDLGSAA